MRKRIFTIILITLVLCGSLNVSFAKGSERGNHILFKIERSRDADEIYYEANLMADGSLNQESPVSIYWKKHTQNGKTELLTKVQNSLSYGLKFQEVTSYTAEFQFVSFEQPMILRKNTDGEYKVFTWIDKQETEVERIYVWFSNKSYWFPKVGRVVLYTKAANTPEILAKVITP